MKFKLLLASLVLVTAAHAQNASTPFCLGVQQAGTPIGAGCYGATINFNTGMTATLTNGVFVITASASGLPAGLTFVAPTLTVSAPGSGNGQLALSGNTSGTCTATTNATGVLVINSCPQQLPDGTKALPALRMTGAADGWYNGTSNGQGTLIYGSTTTDSFAIGPGSTSRAAVNSAGAFCISSSASALNAAGLSCDIFLGRSAPGVFRVGATFNTTTGLLQTGMSTFVTTNFTTSGVGTALEAITGLSITVPALAANWTWHAHLAYSQAVGTAAVAFGIQAVTNNPTNCFATGEMFTAAGTVTTGVLPTLTTTTATAIVSGTPGATATNFITDLYGTCELAASANTIRLLTSTSTAADTVTILRGSYFDFNP